MSDVVKCKSCGSVNNLPEGKTSMYCAYCGNAIEKKETNKKEYESVIKTKPEISQPKIIFEEDPYVRAPAHTVFYKKRVEGGWELHDKYTGVSFYPDVEERADGDVSFVGTQRDANSGHDDRHAAIDPRQQQAAPHASHQPAVQRHDQD
mgnify:CR=1 FL=1